MGWLKDGHDNVAESEVDGAVATRIQGQGPRR